jgi:hypothetical protein
MDQLNRNPHQKQKSWSFNLSSSLHEGLREYIRQTSYGMVAIRLCGLPSQEKENINSLHF